MKTQYLSQGVMHDKALSFADRKIVRSITGETIRTALGSDVSYGKLFNFEDSEIQALIDGWEQDGERFSEAFIYSEQDANYATWVVAVYCHVHDLAQAASYFDSYHDLALRESEDSSNPTTPDGELEVDWLSRRLNYPFLDEMVRAARVEYSRVAKHKTCTRCDGCGSTEYFSRSEVGQGELPEGGYRKAF